MDSCGSNRISDFFANKTILITGGTGFVGKVLIEKLLRDCNSLKKIYVIIRSKKGDNPNERLQKIFTNPLFDRVKEQQGPRVIDKVEAISGDICAPDLGLSAKDRGKLIEETEIVYHSAAITRFDQPLKFTILSNVRGTKLLLQLAKECRKLMVFCYVSTAFCQEKPEVVCEIFYPPPADPDKIIYLSEQLEESELVQKTHKMRAASASNYSFSKALAEGLVEQEANVLPVIIQRLPFVTGTWKEPIPGWMNSIEGVIGVNIAGGTGIWRSLYLKSDSVVISFSPADIVVKNMILNTYYYHIYKSQRVFNVTTPKGTPLGDLTFKKAIEVGLDVVRNKVPLNIMLWYPNLTVRKKLSLFYADFALFHLVPALMVDALVFSLGKNTFLLKTQKRIWKAYQLLDYFVNRTWNFNESSGVINAMLNPTEMEIFGTNVSDFDVEDYAVNNILGGRRYLLKQPDEDIPKALKRVEKLWLADRAFKAIFSSGVGLYVYSKL